jgi:hypothetical protein
VSDLKVVESDESPVIQGRRADSWKAADEDDWKARKIRSR